MPGTTGRTNSQRILVTGGHGFVGTRLVAAFRRRYPEMHVDAPVVSGAPNALDITAAEAVRAYLNAKQPEAVLHLAAVSAVTSSIRDPRQAWNVNLGGTLNLVLALQERAEEVRLLHVSTAEVYGQSFDLSASVAEDTLMRPMNPYAASKASADLLVGQAARSGLRVAIARPFNHTGPGQVEAFVVPSLAGQIARIEANLAEPVLYVGSLDEERDFLDVSDVVEAYLAIFDANAFGPDEIFNIASGMPVKVGDLLEMLLAMSPVRIRIQQDRSRLRSTPLRRVVGDATRLRDRLGWAPRTALDTTLAEVLAFKRAQLGLAD